jgi:hypothetical protein
MEKLTDILVRSHSGWRWVVLILLLAAIFKAFSGWKGKKEWTNSDKKLAMFAMIAFHLQFTFGLILYFLSDLVVFNSSTMSNPVYRFYSVEHILGMMIAMILITIGYGKAKRLTDSQARFKKIFWFYLISLIIVLAMIPWPFRALGGHWF